jgi:type I restriction enzyme S subunit
MAVKVVTRVQKNRIAYESYIAVPSAWVPKIPKHWEFKRVKWTITACQNGIWGGEPTGIEGEDIGCVRVADFDRTRFVVPDDVKLTQRSVEPSKYRDRLLSKGDLLIEKSGGGDLQPVGVVVLYESDAKAVCSNFIARVVVREGYCSSYLRYLHAALYTARLNTRSLKQSTGIQNLDSDQYFSEKVGLPPFAEQRAIAAFLDQETVRIDALIARKQRLIELLEEKRQAVITQAITRGLNPNVEMKTTRYPTIEEVPKHWDVLALKWRWNVVDCKHRTVQFLQEGFPVASIGEVHSFEVDLTNSNRTSEEEYLDLIDGDRKPKRGDIIYSRNATVGEAAFVNTDQDFCLGQDVCLITSTSENQRFLVYQLRSPVVFQQLESLMVGSTFKRINVGQIREFAVACPPRLEQDAIADYCDSASAIFEHARKQILKSVEILTEYRIAIISAAVTGQIDVRKEVKLDG